MFNVGGGEFLVIFLVALVVLGPAKLPDAARQAGNAMREIRRLSAGFQAEMKAAMDDPTEAAARERGRKLVSSEESPSPAPVQASVDTGADLDDPAPTDDHSHAISGDAISGDATPVDVTSVAPDEPPRSTAEAAGMYDLPRRSSGDADRAGSDVGDDEPDP